MRAPSTSHRSQIVGQSSLFFTVFSESRNRSFGISLLAVLAIAEISLRSTCDARHSGTFTFMRKFL